MEPPGDRRAAVEVGMQHGPVNDKRCVYNTDRGACTTGHCDVVYSVTIFAVREKLGLPCREVHGASH